MKVVIQRSKKSFVKVKNKKVGEIDHGLVLLICMENGDSIKTISKAVHKIFNLRIFENKNNGKMDINIKQIGGQALCISQFTLSWDGSRGHRPSFDKSLDPEMARELFDQFCNQLSQHIPTHKGIFGENMIVYIENDGPVTFTLNFN